MVQVVKKRVNEDYSCQPEQEAKLQQLQSMVSSLNTALGVQLVTLEQVLETDRQRLLQYMLDSDIFFKICLNSICSPTSLEFLLVNH